MRFGLQGEEAPLGGGFGEQGVHVGDIDGDLMESPVDLGELGAEVGLDAFDGGVFGGEGDDVGGVGFALGFGEDERFAGVAVLGGVLGGALLAGFAGSGRELGVLAICFDLFVGGHAACKSFTA